MEPISSVVRFEPQSLHRSKLGSITGSIWFEFDGFHFPGANWSDFVVVVLGWWISALRSNDRTHQLLFMDGPLSLRVARQDSEYARVDCMRSGPQEEVKGSFIVTFVDFRQSIVDTGWSVLKACKALNWDSEDLLTLARALEES